MRGLVVINIREWVSFGSNICVLLISVYTFYITFSSKKIKLLSFRETFSNRGNSMSIAIENKTFSSTTILKINMIVDKEQKILFKKYDVPLVMGPFSTKIVTMDKFSKIKEMKKEYNNLIFEIKTSNGTLYLSLDKKIVWLSKSLKKMSPNTTVHRIKYNEKIVMPGTKYILDILMNKNLKTIFIYKSGLMSDNVFGYNAIPKEKMKDINSVDEVIKNLVEDYDVKFNLRKIEDVLGYKLEQKLD